MAVTQPDELPAPLLILAKQQMIVQILRQQGFLYIHDTAM
jgi:hypothetical protein